jgi:glutamine phosphoribosylpyrophosphate amidotransferase
VVECVFATLFPSDCRLCGAPLVKISSLPVWPVKGQEILIVDDIFTTGTTVSECARVLRRSGASKVYVATVARTLKAEARLMGWPQAEERQTMAAAG